MKKSSKTDYFIWEGWKWKHGYNNRCYTFHVLNFGKDSLKNKEVIAGWIFGAFVQKSVQNLDKKVL